MSKIQRQVNLHNDSMRKVKHVHSYQLSRFLSQSSGNFLINGGIKERRRDCLIKFICDARIKSDKTIVVFSDDVILQNKLIELAQNGNIGKLFVCSEDYPNYDFFNGMQSNLICEYFNHLSIERGAKDTAELNSYVDSFLSILSSKFHLNLSSMRLFARNDNLNITNSTTNQYDAEMIISSSKGGVSFRSLLNNTYQAMSLITTELCETGLCINNLIKEDCILFINTPAFNHEIFSIYFAMELKSLLNQEFVCVFDDSILLDNDVMCSIVNIMKQQQQITVVVSYENIMSLNSKETVPKNFNRNLIFLNGNTPYVDLQYVLSSFGQYTHMQSMSNSTTPPKLLFTLYRGEGESAVSYSRDRVLLQEEYTNEALLKGGSSSEIVVVKKLLI